MYYTWDGINDDGRGQCNACMIVFKGRRTVFLAFSDVVVGGDQATTTENPREVSLVLQHGQ